MILPTGDPTDADGSFPGPSNRRAGMTISVAALEACGYRSYSSHKGDGLYQKWIRNEAGEKLFALNFYIWRHLKGEDAFSVEARLYQAGSLSGEGASFDLGLMLGDAATVEGVEAWFRQSFVALQCVPDLHDS